MPIEPVLHAVLLDGTVKVLPAMALLIAIGIFTGQRAFWTGAGLAALYIADYAVLRIADWLPAAQIAGPGLNWDGKLYSIILGLSILAALPQRQYEQIGLFQAPSPTHPTLYWGLVAAFVAASIARGIAADRPFALETVAYQATMPGIDEEIFYRGIFWIMIANALDRVRMDAGRFPWFAFAITTGMFAWVHAAGVDDTGAFYFNAASLSVPLLTGAFLGATQGLGRAVWVPIILHNVWNTALYL